MRAKDPRHTARQLALASIFSWVFNEPETFNTVELSKELLSDEEGLEIGVPRQIDHTPDSTTNQSTDQATGHSTEQTSMFDPETFNDDQNLTKYIFEGVKANIDEIDKIIVECAPEWPLDKIAKIDLVILRIAIFEVVFGTKTPVKVAIDEAVELAKEFGTDTSHKFINGVLGTVVEKHVQEHQPNSDLQK